MLDITTAQPAAPDEAIQVVRLGGRLDSATAREFDEFLARLLMNGRRFLMLEADELRFVSSAGIGVLVRLIRSLEGEGGAACLVRPNDEIAMLLEFFGLSDHLPFFDVRADAVQYLSRCVAELRPGLSLSAEDRIAAQAFAAPPAPPTEGATSESTARVRPRAIVPISDDTQEITDTPVAAQPIPSLDEPEFRAALRSDIRRVIREESAVAPAPAPAASPPPPPAAQHNVSTDGLDRKAPLAAPTVIRCEQCAGKFRVRTSGKHMCPHCQVRIRVRRDATVSYMERL